MSESFDHLSIQREPLQNDRRTRTIRLPHPDRGDLKAHGEKLNDDLKKCIDRAQKQIVSRPGNFYLKLRYSGLLDSDHLIKHGVEFISHEEKEIFVVFSDESGIKIFSEHINRLGLEDAELSYKQILEAIDGIDNWTSDDRKSWALSHKGFPELDEFVLDVELWPLYVSHHPIRLELCSTFEEWLHASKITQIDKINLDSLLIYRLQVNKRQAEMLLDHTDVRIIDLSPKKRD